ncbi:peptidoglycan-binding protein [Kitasatospora sp. NPDC092286]|uniref:peptidoglycan-binding domain-containing protein n=1 Tax=Kitasatospora sp. NPDC092286 TaxID=3364087 RepID=UPI003804F1BB
MPDQHCPTCGTARSAGCRCLPDLPDPSLAETAVLPHLEGPPLVRPYVPQAVGQIVDGPSAGAPADPFATTVLPPVAPPPGPDADAYATTVLPPVMSVPPPAPPRHPQHPQHSQHPQEQPEPADDEIGFFPFAHSAPGAPEPAGGGRAARRAAEQAEQGPLARRKGLLVAAGAGLLAVTIGLAYAVTPSKEPDHQARPAPSTTLAPAPVDPTTPADPSPSAPPSTTEAEAPSPSPSRTTAKASPTKAATPPPMAPTPPPAAPPAPADPPPAPPSPTTTPTPTPTTSASPTTTPQTLTFGMTGASVKDMQLRLVAASCGTVDKSLATGFFDWWTRNTVLNFQQANKIKGENGEYGPKTRAALEQSPPSC